MIKNMMQQTKRHLAMLLAAAVVVAGLPVMTADAEEQIPVATVSDNDSSLSDNDPSVSDNDPSVSDNDGEDNKDDENKGDDQQQQPQQPEQQQPEQQQPTQQQPEQQQPAPQQPEQQVVKPTIKLNAKSIKLQVKKSTTAVVASGLVKGDKVASWTSSNKKVVTVTSKGKITAKKVGTATITVKTKLGAKATLKVTVQKKAVALKSISVNKKKVTLKKGKSFAIVATKSPITAQDKVTYKTSNKKVATVSSKGVIKAKKAGTATITVKAGKKTAKVKVTVKK